ncbi:MAG: MFS transporter [Proteobacteria bacterium]|nr:MFS transporter [Pseudomonadota bacterium]
MQEQNRQNSVFSVWLMWSLASFFYAYQYVLRVLPNIMMSDLLEKFQIDASLFGQYSGLYYIGYAGMHIPVGILLDKYGPKWVLPICMMLTVIGLMPLLYADNWMYPGIGRLLIGMGSSAAILGVFKIIRMSFPEDKFTFILGCSVTIGLIGAIYGGQPINYLMQAFGSQTVLQIIILIGIVLALTTFWVIPVQKISAGTQSWLKSVKAVLMNRDVILICLFSGLMVGPLEGFADVWGKEYLELVYKLNENVAASLPSLIFLGMCIGSPLLSWISEKTKAYFSFIILSGVVMGISFCLLLMGQLPVSVLTAMFVIVGIFCAYQILAIYKASTYGGEQLVGLTTACANMIIMTFGYVFHSIIGQIMTYYWDGTMSGQTPVYDAHAYTLALVVIPIGLMAGAVGFIWLATSKRRSTFAIQKF